MLNKLCLYLLRNMRMIADLGPHRIEGREKGSLFIGPTDRLQWKEWVIRTKLLRF